MSAAALPHNEQDRLHNLYSYELLDTLPEQDYDDITKLASYICDTPVSLVTLLDTDRQWFKSAHGVDINQTSREDAFCSHAILKPDEMMIVPDAKKDKRFWDNPLVTGDYNVIFYAGVPLLTEEGYPIGSLCVLDNKPRDLNESQQAALKTLANQVMRLMQLHKKTKELTHSRQLIEEVNKELENFAQVTAENLKQPCDNAIEFADIIAEKSAGALDADGKQILSLIKYSCESIKSIVDDTLERTKRIGLLQDSKTLFTVAGLMQELKQRASSTAGNILFCNQDTDAIYFFKSLLLQILTSVVTASLQFNKKEDQQVEISYRQNKDQYIFTITDNGRGTPVFLRGGELVLLQSSDNNLQDQHYISHLNSARQLIASLSGALDMSFDQTKGTVFVISLPK